MKAYWDARYQQGIGNGFAGSIGAVAQWKWDTILQYVNPVDNVIDVGCGDCKFWEGRNCQIYTGIDIVQSIIHTNKQVRPHWKFIAAHAEDYFPYLQSDIVLCMDLLFHILDEEVFINILTNLTKYAKQWIFIYTWATNPFLSRKFRYNLLRTKQFKQLLLSLFHKLTTDHIYQQYRKFEVYLPLFTEQGFELVTIERNTTVEAYGALFVFHKQEV